jgi:hypothetical protein
MGLYYTSEMVPQNAFWLVTENRLFKESAFFPSAFRIASHQRVHVNVFRFLSSLCCAAPFVVDRQVARFHN